MTCVIVMQMAAGRRFRRYLGIRRVRETSDRRRRASRRQGIATPRKKVWLSRLKYVLLGQPWQYYNNIIMLFQASFRESSGPVVDVGHRTEDVRCRSHHTVHGETFLHIRVVDCAKHGVDNNRSFPADRFWHHHFPHRPGGPPKTSTRLVIGRGDVLGHVDSVLLFLE